MSGRETVTRPSKRQQPTPAPDPGGSLRVQGRLLASRIEFLRHRHGPEVLGRCLERLSTKDRDAFGELDTDRWYPFAMLVRFDRAITDTLGPDPGAVLEELGAWSARLHTTWLGRDAPLVSAHAFLARLAEDHRRLVDFGHAEYRRHAFREGELRYSGYPRPEPSYCRSGVGFLRRAVQLLCSSPVSVEEVRCQCRGDDACVYRICWK